MPDGSLNIKDRTQEFITTYYAKHDLYWEMLASRIAKQAMWHAIKASLYSNLVVPAENSRDIYFGNPNPTYSHHDSHIEEKAWRPQGSLVKYSIYQPLVGEKQPSISLRGRNQNAYWHTAKFVSSVNDGEIIIKFDAKNSITASQHKIWIIEDGLYRTLGKILADNNWRTFEIHIKTTPSSILEFQIDQPNNWQWLSIRDFRVINAKSPSAAAFTKTSMLKTALHRVLANETIHPFNDSYAPRSYMQRPANLTPLDGSGRPLTTEEGQYYFYHAIKTIARKARERKMDFICFLMPDSVSVKLMPAIQQLRREGVKVIAYQPNEEWPTGVKSDWYWQKADSHWTEAAVRLTVDEIGAMWGKNIVANRPFTKLIMAKYSKRFSQKNDLMR